MLLCDVTFNRETQTAEFIAWKQMFKGAKKGLRSLSKTNPLGGIYRDTVDAIDASRKWNVKAKERGVGPIGRLKGTVAAYRRPIGMVAAGLVNPASLGSPFGSAAGNVLYKGMKAAGRQKGNILEKVKAGVKRAGKSLKSEALNPTGTIATGLGAPVGKINMVQKAGNIATKRAKTMAAKGTGALKTVGKTLTTPVGQLWQQRKAITGLNKAKPQLPRTAAAVYSWRKGAYATFRRKLMKGRKRLCHC